MHSSINSLFPSYFWLCWIMCMHFLLSLPFCLSSVTKSTSPQTPFLAQHRALYSHGKAVWVFYPRRYLPGALLHQQGSRNQNSERTWLAKKKQPQHPRRSFKGWLWFICTQQKLLNLHPINSLPSPPHLTGCALSHVSRALPLSLCFSWASSFLLWILLTSPQADRGKLCFPCTYSDPSFYWKLQLEGDFYFAWGFFVCFVPICP